MTRRRLLIFGRTMASVVATGVVASITDAKRESAVAGIRHGALHFNCPPGSHGTPRFAKSGRSLGHGSDPAGIEALGRSVVQTTAKRTGY